MISPLVLSYPPSKLGVIVGPATDVDDQEVVVVVLVEIVSHIINRVAVGLLEEIRSRVRHCYYTISYVGQVQLLSVEGRFLLWPRHQLTNHRLHYYTNIIIIAINPTIYSIRSWRAGGRFIDLQDGLQFGVDLIIFNLSKSMYRQSNDRYSENNQMNPMNNYPPMPTIPKMHSHLEGYNPPPMPYYDNPQTYQFAQQPPPPPPNEGGYDTRFASWRDVSESKNAMIVNPNIPPMNPIAHYEVRPPMHLDPYGQGKGLQGQNFPPVPTSQVQVPQMNVVQRISGIVKSQLSFIHSIMLYADRKTQQQKNKKERERSRSRSRSKDRGPKHNPRDRQRQKHHREWNCIKCTYLNFDFRDRCKRCNEPKPESHRFERVESGGKNYVPGPDDWKCNKCGNINYARRIECHRCHSARIK